jgi:hypothetical protein
MMRVIMAVALVCVVPLASCKKGEPTGPSAGDGAYLANPPGPKWSGTAASVTVGERAACLLAADGTPWCWGNRFGVGLRIDDGIRSTDPSRTAEWIAESICAANAVPGQPAGWPCNVLHPVRMSAQSFVSLRLSPWDAPLCGVDAAGKGSCWDQGSYLQVPGGATLVNGIWWCGTTYCLDAPQPMRGASPVRDVIAGQATCALTTEGVLQCAASNYYNLLSPTLNLGFISDTLVPIASTAAFASFAVSPDGYAACAVATAGKAYCWGNNGYGQAGVNSTAARITGPTQIASTLTFTQVVAGQFSACALSTAGKAYCWGDGRTGSLGWGGLGASPVPVAVSGSHTFTSLTMGVGHVCGLEGTTAWCWGSNNLGELGSARSSCTGGFCASAPVQVQGGLAFKQLSAGTAATCGVTTAGDVYCWGQTEYGTLGPAADPLVTPFIAQPVKITP